ncbi:MAG TPA: hypothetical protein VKU94_07510 [Geobacterales bacterium]|nr:hypothetical protein [Geobacterales bacterium]
MDFTYELFNLFIFACFAVISLIFASIVRKPMSILPSFFFGVGVYVMTYNGLIAGLSAFLLTVLLQLAS